MIKKISLIFVSTVILCTGILVACDPTDSGTIKIGNISSMTGALSSYGQSHTNAVKLAVEQVNNAGGILGKQIELVTEDDQGDAVIGVNAAKKLINQGGITAIVGPIPSKIGSTVAPVVQEAKMPTVVTGTSPAITVGKDFVFRSCWTDDFQGVVLAKFAFETLGSRNAAVLYDLGNDYAKSVSEVFIATFKTLGGTIVALETHPTDATDFRAQLTNIKAANPDLFFFPDFYNDASLIAKQAREMGVDCQYMGADGWDSPDLDLVALEGAYYASHFSKDDTRPETRAFVDDYTKKYGNTPDLLAIMGYDAAIIVIDAIRRAGSTDPVAVRDAIQATDNLAGAQGNISFNENGDPKTLPAAILQIVNGLTKYVTTVSP